MTVERSKRRSYFLLPFFITECFSKNLLLRIIIIIIIIIIIRRYTKALGRSSHLFPYENIRPERAISRPECDLNCFIIARTEPEARVTGFFKA